MSFQNERNEITTKTLTITNKTNQAIRFSWEYLPSEFLPQAKNQNGSDYVETFFFCNKRGVILPKSTFEFKICYRSKQVGMFCQRWKFNATPNLFNAEFEDNIITFQGLTTEDDTNEQKKRQNIVSILQKRE